MSFASCIVMQLCSTNQRNAQFYKLILNFRCSCFEPRGFILLEKVEYAVYANVSLWMNPLGSKHVGDIRN